LGAILLLAVSAASAGETAPSSAVSSDRLAAAAVEKAHAVLWNKFIGNDGLIHDYVGELPTPEDCQQGRPNAIGWWSPIENGPMFTGTYLAAISERARRSGAAADREKARRLARGLIACASVSDVPGFIARGMGTDGRCHYPMGSQDQTHPWFYGLHAYATSGIPDAGERRLVVDKMKEVAEALEAADWKCPCDGAFRGQFRGDFKMFRHHGAAMYLFILRAMHDVTGESVWLDRYQKARHERCRESGKSRLQICAEGYPHDHEQIKNIDRGQLWIYVSSQGGLARLADWEIDESARARYREGLLINARGALAVIDVCTTFDNNDTRIFGHARWREGYPAWFPQKTQADAEKMASMGDRNILGERKWYEASRMRNPLAAAALIALAGCREGFEPVRQAICHYDYTRLNMAEFFFAECAYYALPVEKAGDELKGARETAGFKSGSRPAGSACRAGSVRVTALPSGMMMLTQLGAQIPLGKRDLPGVTRRDQDSNHVRETLQTMKTETIEYFGYSDCIAIENATTRVVLCPQAGGRVLEYSLNGANALYLNPEQQGWRHKPGVPRIDPCGGRFDVGPERVITPHPDLWLGDWTGQIAGDGKARLTSLRDETTGLRLVREFTLAPDSSRLDCEQRIINESDKPVMCCHWSRTLAVGGGICLIPLTPDSRFPKSYLMYGPGPVMNFQPVDPNIRIRDGFLEILGTPANPKLGMDSAAGWFAYLMRNDVLFVKRFPVDPDRVYCEMAGLTISIWYYKNEMCELEPIGPRETLAPGASASYTEQWELFPCRFPEEQASVDLSVIRQLAGAAQ